jgi:hypothetical protein
LEVISCDNITLQGIYHICREDDINTCFKDNLHT